MTNGDADPTPILRYVGYRFADEPTGDLPRIGDIHSQCRECPVNVLVYGYLLAYPDDRLDFESTEHYESRFDWGINNFLDYCESAAEQYGSAVRAAYHRQNGLGNLAYSNPRWELYDDHFYFGATPV